MTDQISERPAVVPYAPKEKSTVSEAEIVDRAGNAILGWLVGRLTRLRLTSKRHGKSLGNLQTN
ncbi:MAG: hypothetical protein WA728_32305 [Xanthobacteraceae bacterium]